MYCRITILVVSQISECEFVQIGLSYCVPITCEIWYYSKRMKSHRNVISVKSRIQNKLLWLICDLHRSSLLLECLVDHLFSIKKKTNLPSIDQVNGMGSGFISLKLKCLDVIVHNDLSFAFWIHVLYIPNSQLNLHFLSVSA